ncbi:hypothetical protein GCM10023340_12980 [Nocardioides marinquilinus]|uniref:Uncharacterized protein n=1 Tax=Nocardioides marinquilinus TaxID=1210400 RepID=A0ABP9PDE0_9ACTN
MLRRLVLPTLLPTLLALALTACSGEDDEPADDRADEPVPPAGMVYVGVDGVVAAVPEAWAPASDPLCGGTAADAYWLAQPDPPGVECPVTEPGTEQPRFLEIHGADGPGVGGYPCLADRCPEVWRLDDVSFLVGSQHPSLVAGDPPPTLRLPDGWTTVPFWPAGAATEDDYRAVLAEAGLGDVVTIDDAGARTTTPAQGAVVRVP